MVARKIEERDAQSERRAARRADGLPDRAAFQRAQKTPVAAAVAPAWQQRSLRPQDQNAPRAPLAANDAAARERHERRKGWFLMEAARQAANRATMSRCESFYDSEQWNKQDAQDVRDRGQNPVVYNEIKPTIDWLIGTERRMRIDFNVVAEGEEDEDSDDAANKTKLLKYLDDTNKAAFERSWASEDSFKAGIGWLEVGVRGDKSDVPIFKGAVPWREMLWDSQGSTRRDIQDSRYIFRVKVVDEDVAKAIFAGKEAEIDRVVQTGDNMQVFSEWLQGLGLITGLDQFSFLNDDPDVTTPRPVDLFNTRRRVLLLECWSREPVRRKPSVDGMGDPVQFEIHVAIMTEHDTLIEGRSPYKHDRFPFIPIWAYRNRRTGLPYSPIYPLLGPQEALNHRMSKSLYEASANQWEMEVGAIDSEVMTVTELQAEYNDPSGVAVYANGALQHNKVRKVQDSGKMREQLVLAERDIAHIRGTSGVTGENRGEETNSVSGRAVIAKQDQGSLLTMELFDNILYAHQMEGEITLSLAEQYIVNPMVVRVAGDGGRVERTKINTPQVQPDGTVIWLNDITARRAHFVIGEQPWKQTYAEASFESLMEVLSQLAPAAPQVVVNLLDLVFDMHPNLPRKRQIVERMRSVNGQADPDGKLTPEQQAERQRQQAMAKAQFDAAMAELHAKIRQANANGMKLEAGAVFERLNAIKAAAEAAIGLTTLPQATPIADELLKSAGFKDQTEGDSVIDSPAGALQAVASPPEPVVPADPNDPAAGQPPAAQPEPGAPGAAPLMGM